MSLKLKINPEKAASSATDNVPPTPGSTTSAGPKLKLKASQPPTPALEQPLSATLGGSKGRQRSQPSKSRKPTGGAASKKRAANDDSISPAVKRVAKPSRKISLKITPHAAANADDVPQSASGLGKLSLKRRSTVPKILSIHTKRRPPTRNPGVGYDSEDSDAEDDPAIQQAFVLRMQPGEDCDYLHDAIANGRVGFAKEEGGAEVSIRFLDKELRRALVTVRQRMYAAVLVDLPCIVETMKSWDRKGWWKVADMSQMLLVLGRCNGEEEAKTFPLPREVDKETLQYAHGLTPPMHWVRKRRFRKRLSYKTIANVDEEVERLLKEDEETEKNNGEVSLDYLNRKDYDRNEDPEGPDYDDEEDAEGEAIETTENGQDYEEYYSDDEGDADLEGNLQAMFDEDHASAAVPPPQVQNVLPESPAPLVDQAASFAAVENGLASDSAAETPGQEITTQDEEEESSSEEGSDDEDDEDSPDVMDEDAAAKAAERNQQLEEVADLEREIENQKRKVEAISNQLLKQRAVAQLRTLEEDLRVKRGVFGLDADEDEGEEEG